MIVRGRDSYRARRIAPGDTNKMVPLFDPLSGPVGFVAVIEIFEVGGKTPPNQHEIGQEMFFVLRGEGIAHADGAAVPLKAGDSLCLLPGTEHVIENTGRARLYCLTYMVPNDGFAELIHGGEEVPIDDEDWAVISGTGAAA